ncbi:MAG: TonB-dependent receptor plug domain-containing protein [Psychrosphaera sp.]|nr:TonB-dependent receptor plug domain-containing protein [Psychrosphaera sp.]
MKIWPLLITSMFPFVAYPAVNNDLSEDSAYEESEDEEEYEDEDEDFEGFYGDEDFVSISTGTKKSLAKAPSVASVITAKQIKAMGARTLSDVLSTVPGVNLSNSGQISSQKYFIRGIFSLDNPHPLFLVNGTPNSSVIRGDRSAVVPTFPVGSIARIEVIRGPGSALHGADAFAGVINIITKGVGDIDGTIFGTRFGSFDTQDVWTNMAFEMGEVEMAFSVDYTTTQGHKEIIDADVQTTLDDIFGTNASLAPGPVNMGYRAFDTRFDLVYKDFNLKIGFQDRDNVGTGKGGATALDPHGKLGSERLQINLNYLNNIN